MFWFEDFAVDSTRALSADTEVVNHLPELSNNGFRNDNDGSCSGQATNPSPTDVTYHDHPVQPSCSPVLGGPGRQGEGGPGRHKEGGPVRQEVGGTGRQEGGPENQVEGGSHILPNITKFVVHINKDASEPLGNHVINS